jgi:hypothetical protein
MAVYSGSARLLETAGITLQRQLPGEDTMLWTICVILIVLWLLGMVSSYTMGGLIHILLVIAIIVVLVRIIQGRKVL